MIIFAIDPGSTESGWVVFDTQKREVLHSGNHENERVKQLMHSLGKTGSASLLLCERPELIGQQIWHQILDTCMWVGKFTESWNGEHILYKRNDVKRTLLGRINVPNSDGAVRQYCLNHFGEPGTKKNPGPTYGVTKHAWQALGLVATWEELQSQIRRSNHGLVG